MKKDKFRIGNVFSLLWIWLAVVAVLFLPSFFSSRPFLGEMYSRKGFPLFIALPIRLQSLFPFSLTEFFVIFGSIFFIFLLVFTIIRFVKTPYKVGFLFRFFSWVGVAFLVISLMYVFLHGINFFRMPLLSPYSTRQSLEQIIGENVVNKVKTSLEGAVKEELSSEIDPETNQIIEDYQTIREVSLMDWSQLDLNALLKKGFMVEEKIPFHPSVEELTTVCQWLVENANALREQRKTDANGVMILSHSLKQTLETGNVGLDQASMDFVVLKGPQVTPKKVLLSHWWSYTGIAGMYFPWFGESNINVDIAHADLPFVICHELSHIRGIARENEANLAAFLGSIYHTDPDYQYSGYQMALKYCLDDLQKTSPEAADAIRGQISPAIFKDWQNIHEYWKQFEGKVQEISVEANDAFLKANQQTQGVVSYDEVTKLIAEYYFFYKVGEK